MSGYSRSRRKLRRELTLGVPTVATLNGRRRFSRPIVMGAVAAMVGAGLAVLLSQHNGPKPQIGPAANAVGPADVRTVQVEVTGSGCTTNAPTYPSGRLLVSIDNSNAIGLGTVSLLENGMPLGQRDFVTPGSSGSFSVDVQPGNYVVACPGTTNGQTPISVVGPRISGSGPDSTLLLATAGRTYSAYVSAQAGRIIHYLSLLVSYARNDRLELSGCAYWRAGRSLHHISEAAGIDQIGGDQLEAGWASIGKILYEQNTRAGVAEAATKLLVTARRLEASARKLHFDSVNAARAALDQIMAIFRSEMFRASGPSAEGNLTDMYRMVQGSEAATDKLRPVLSAVDPNFTKQIDTAYGSFDHLISAFHDTRIQRTGGFVRFSDIDVSTKKSISQALRAIEVCVSRIPAKLVRQ